MEKEVVVYFTSGRYIRRKPDSLVFVSPASLARHEWNLGSLEGKTVVNVENVDYLREWVDSRSEED